VRFRWKDYRNHLAANTKRSHGCDPEPYAAKPVNRWTVCMCRHSQSACATNPARRSCQTTDSLQALAHRGDTNGYECICIRLGCTRPSRVSAASLSFFFLVACALYNASRTSGGVNQHCLMRLLRIRSIVCSLNRGIALTRYFVFFYS
jgi:hypothetical protein